MTIRDDDRLRQALRSLTAHDERAAPRFDATLSPQRRARSVRWLRIAVMVGGLAAAAGGALVLQPHARPVPVADTLLGRDLLLASATRSLLVHDTPDFMSSFALARRMAANPSEGR